jgi:ABC-type sulfate/molybdate transport systems ATPase subunit
VIHGVDLELAAGEVVALLGPNGAGKSTLLGALAGSIELSAGSVERDGRVAVAMQSPDLAKRSVQANVELALAWWGVPRGPQRSERALRALAQMRVDGLARRRAESLSGGERRRVHLARALALEPDLLLLDEPFAGLDAEARARLLIDSTGVLRSQARGTLVVVHDRAEAWALADRIVVLLEGAIAAVGRPQELLSAPPSAGVARFLGFDGHVRDGDDVLLTRPAGVRLNTAGPMHGTVTAVMALEDGARVEVTLSEPGSADSAQGVLYVVSPWPAPELGSRVAVEVTAAARFPGSELPQA